MMTKRITLYVDQGADFHTTLNLSGSEFPLITSNTDFFSSARKVFSSKKAFDFVIEDSGNNTISISTTSEDTLDVMPGKYEYDILMKTDDHKTIKILEGLVFVIPTITEIEN